MIVEICENNFFSLCWNAMKFSLFDNLGTKKIIKIKFCTKTEFIKT